MNKAIVALIVIVVVFALWMFLAPDRTSAPSEEQQEEVSEEAMEEEVSQDTGEDSTNDIEADLEGLDSTDIEAELDVVDQDVEQL